MNTKLPVSRIQCEPDRTYNKADDMHLRASIKSRLDKAEKALNEKKAKGKRLDGLTGALRQATWLVGLLAGAWVVTTLIRALT